MDRLETENKDKIKAIIKDLHSSMDRLETELKYQIDFYTSLFTFQYG